jgi:TIR domain
MDEERADMSDPVAKLVQLFDAFDEELYKRRFRPSDLIIRNPDALTFIKLHLLEDAHELVIAAERKMFKMLAAYARARKDDERMRELAAVLQHLVDADRAAQDTKYDTQDKVLNQERRGDLVAYYEFLFTVYRRLVSEHYKVLDCALFSICPMLPPDLREDLERHLRDLQSTLDKSFLWLRQVFLCYRSCDGNAYRENIVEHLTPLLRREHIDLWHDGEEEKATNVTEQMRRRIRRSRVAVLVVTRHFADRYGYCVRTELPLMREAGHYMRYFPIFVADRKKVKRWKHVSWVCDWRGMDWPSPGTPDLEPFFAEIAAGIKARVEELTDVARAKEELLKPLSAA